MRRSTYLFCLYALLLFWLNAVNYTPWWYQGYQIPDLDWRFDRLIICKCQLFFNHAHRISKHAIKQTLHCLSGINEVASVDIAWNTKKLHFPIVCLQAFFGGGGFASVYGNFANVLCKARVGHWWNMVGCSFKTVKRFEFGGFPGKGLYFKGKGPSRNDVIFGWK